VGGGGGERPAVRPPPGEVVVEVGHLGLGFLRVRGRVSSSAGREFGSG
jgi:hypothetical protein